MSAFEGIGSVLGILFGADTTITRKATQVSQTVTARLTWERVVEEIADGRDHMVSVPVLHMAQDQAADLHAGDTVSSPDAPGKLFKVLRRLPAAFAAADAEQSYVLEEIP